MLGPIDARKEINAWTFILGNAVLLHQYEYDYYYIPTSDVTTSPSGANMTTTPSGVSMTTTTSGMSLLH